MLAVVSVVIFIAARLRYDSNVNEKPIFVCGLELDYLPEPRKAADEG